MNFRKVLSFVELVLGVIFVSIMRGNGCCMTTPCQTVGCQKYETKKTDFCKFHTKDKYFLWKI